MKSRLISWKNFISACIGALTITAFDGIVGNRADTLFTLVWPFIQAVMIANLLSWCIVIAVVLINIVICMYLIQRSQTLKQASVTDHKLLSLDDSLLRGLASWTPSSLDAETAMKRIITDSLLDATVEFDGQVHRAALLLADASGENLNCWANYRMSQESVDNMKFYIGPDQGRVRKEGGVAGEVFLSGELQVGHLRQAANGTWICEDCHSYIKLSGRHSFPPYLSFVNIPIIGTDPNTQNSAATTCLGVICFDSMNKDIFDSEASQIILRTFARRIAAALLIFRHYQKLSSLSPPQGNSNP